MRINVHIERLVLEGLPATAHQAAEIQRAVETELAGLLARGGLSRELRGGIAVPRVRAGILQLGPDNRPAQLGRGIARAVHSGIGDRKAGTGKR